MPAAATAIAGLLPWLWDSQHVTDLPRDMAKGQAGTLGVLVASLGQHWPPAPAPWFQVVQAFPDTMAKALASLEELPYSDELYRRMDEVMGEIGEHARALPADVRQRFPERLPDAAAWILGTLVERNTYSWTEGSVPEDIYEGLKGVYAHIAADGQTLFWSWLVEGFREVREGGLDELDRWKYGIGEQSEQEEDEVENGSEPEDEEVSTPRLSREEREARIEELLEEGPKDTADDVPEGLLALIVDESYLPLIEKHLDPTAPVVVLANAVQVIGLLAWWEWDHREIKSPETSIPKLQDLYEATSIRRIRRLIVQTLSHFDPTEVPFDFLVDRLAVDHVALKADILAALQFVVDRPYLRELVTERLLPMLHQFCEYPLRKSVYRDEFLGEMDFRFWVFRCLRGIGSADSVPVIERYLDANEWPLETLVEAAHAHWAITHTAKYLEVLCEAKRRGALGNAEGALKEMEKFVRAQARARKKGTDRP